MQGIYNFLMWRPNPKTELEKLLEKILGGEKTVFEIIYVQSFNLCRFFMDSG